MTHPKSCLQVLHPLILPIRPVLHPLILPIRPGRTSSPSPTHTAYQTRQDFKSFTHSYCLSDQAGLQVLHPLILPIRPVLHPLILPIRPGRTSSPSPTHTAYQTRQDFKCFTHSYCLSGQSFTHSYCLSDQAGLQVLHPLILPIRPGRTSSASPTHTAYQASPSPTHTAYQTRQDFKSFTHSYCLSR